MTQSKTVSEQKEVKFDEVSAWSVRPLVDKFCPHGYLLLGPGGLKDGDSVVLKSDFDAVVSERDRWKAHFDVKQGVCQELIKEIGEKNVEIQRLRDALARISVSSLDAKEIASDALDGCFEKPN